MTAEFHRQDATTAPNLTRANLTWHNSAHHCSDSKKKKGAQAGSALRAPLAGDVVLALTAVSDGIVPG